MEPHGWRLSAEARRTARTEGGATVKFLYGNPRNPFQFFETNDGGVMRSSGKFVDRSEWCDAPERARPRHLDRRWHHGHSAGRPGRDPVLGEVVGDARRHLRRGLDR